ncbi:wiskott-Aldrich syndrome protein homolog [Schistocerca gregaria]|uniref:wiskott-Aldrich syndrome protein homolog n=1 Tax=Schistocerca gregaria TaxID=7010 RepID=UPI00211EEBC1|nr:wiskott-Aldrich syndrome protein homolog [Schistocerca gregaria]
MNYAFRLFRYRTSGVVEITVLRKAAAGGIGGGSGAGGGVFWPRPPRVSQRKARCGDGSGSRYEDARSSREVEPLPAPGDAWPRPPPPWLLGEPALPTAGSVRAAVAAPVPPGRGRRPARRRMRSQPPATRRVWERPAAADAGSAHADTRRGVRASAYPAPSLRPLPLPRQHALNQVERARTCVSHLAPSAFGSPDAPAA